MTDQNINKNAKAARETKAWFEDLVEHALDLFQCVDSEGRFIYVNQAWLTTLNYSPEEIENITIWDIIHPDSIEHCMAAFEQVLAGKAFGEVDAVFITKDGTPVMVEGNINVKLDENGHFVHTRGIFRDVTARRHMEKVLQENRNLLNSIFQSIQEGISVLNTDLTIREVNQTMEKWYGHAMPLTGKKCYEVYQNRSDPCASCPVVEALEKKTVCFEIVPFMGKDEQAGWLELYAYPLIENTTGSVTGVIEFVRNITERKMAENALRESEEKHRFLAENMGDIIWTLDLDYRTTFVSPSITRILGYTPEERKHQTLSEVMTPESQIRSIEMLKQELAREEEGTHDPERSASIEVEYYHRDGSTVWMENIMRALRDEEGCLIGIYGVSRDISERKRAEEVLQQEKAFQAILLDLAAGFINVPLVELDKAIDGMLKNIGEFTGLDRVYLFLHDRLRRVTTNTHEWCREGITSEKDNLQETPFDFFLDFLKIWEKGENVHIPIVARMPEEHAMRSILLQQGIQSLLLIPLMQDNVNIGFVGFDAVNECKSFSEQEIKLLRVLAEIISNVFARKGAEAELEALKSFNESIVQNITEGIIISNLNGIVAFANPALLRMLGYSVEEFIGSHWTLIVPAEHHKLVESVDARRIAGKADRYELFLKHKNGNLLPFQVSGSPHYNHATGEIDGTMAVLTDISKRKQAEEALKESEQKHREILAAMEEGYYEVDLAGNFVFCNESFYKMAGYSYDELMGESYNQFYKNPQEVFQAFNQVYKNGTPVTAVDWPAITRDGRKVNLELSISLRRDDKGEPIGFRGVIRDITERRQVEEKIRFLSFHDQLTGLYNRHFLEEEMKRLDTERQLPISIIMADLNGLKLVNDTYGHQTGDE
ncbi:MAG: PAS domain S-box protein, partial [Bacillota bacterium]